MNKNDKYKFFKIIKKQNSTKYNLILISPLIVT